ncbi:MFS transporter [Priestia taiwanensis]|uniref:MFS transporter n=1 Tax=Priestia taiwanensis TaxID=1347902 RepID=A0A917ES99_9BACI|nr:MFS transporter [Priestia taiwanensis]MBM7363788.1 YQGE family putative transporter [Priestia taiwanensis]GGE74086.1 MFS transporter [Priestia taiwanensis]
MNIKKLTGSAEVARDFWLLLIIGGLYTLSVSLSNTFVNIYLWKQSGQFIHIALYNLTIFIIQPLAFYCAGKLASKVDRVFALRIGVTTLGLFYIAVLIAGEHAIRYYFFLGVLLGIGYGFYWLAFNLLIFEITEPETRDFFNGTLGIITSFAGIAGPMIAGFTISRMFQDKGYVVIFCISLALFALAVVASLFLHRREVPGTYAVFHVLRERKYNDGWRRITLAHFFQGLREGSFMFVISIYVFIVTNSELALGTYGMLNSFVSFVAYYIASRFIKKEHRKKFILIGGLMLFLSVALIVFRLTYTNFLIYAACIAIAYPILLVPYGSMTYDIIGKAKDIKARRVEYIVVREWFLYAGRIASVLSFIVMITLFELKVAIPAFLLIFGAGHACIYPIVKGIQDTSQTETKPSVQVAKEGDELPGGKG